MDPEMLPTVVGGLIAAAAGILAWALGAVVSGREARQQRDFERIERRYDDVRVVYVRFCAEMRELVEKAERDEFDNEGRNYADRGEDIDPFTHRIAGRRAQVALDELRLFADEALYGAALAWLNAYYARYWNVDRREHSSDLEAMEDRVIEEGKRALNVPA